MKDNNRGKDIVFGIYFLTVLLLAIIYFSVPERGPFIENQLEWWGEFLEVTRSLI